LEGVAAGVPRHQGNGGGNWDRTFWLECDEGKSVTKKRGLKKRSVDHKVDRKIKKLEVRKRWRKNS